MMLKIKYQSYSMVSSGFQGKIIIGVDNES